MNKDLALYRLATSREKLAEAEILIKNNQYKGSVSRAYYAMFSAAKALLEAVS